MNSSHRILIIDDTPTIHDDFRKIFAAPLTSKPNARIDNLAAAIFDSGSQISVKPEVVLDFAFQGQEGLELVRTAVSDARPYALAFVDMRMPPGWDGLETIPRLWEADPALQVVICTAYSDHGWPAISKRLGRSDKLIILKKPFDEIEVLQLTQALTEKCRLAKVAALKLGELEAMVARRTAELQRATALAERSNRAKSVFLATISHELRTPLNGILGTANLLLNAKLDPEQQELVQTLNTSGTILGNLINDLLDISKIESGVLQLQPDPFSLQETLDSVLRLLTPKASEKKLTLTVDSEPSIPPTLIGDNLRLRQVLLNLIDNAIKFTNTGSVTLKVHQIARDQKHATLRFDIRDTGIGISQEDQARLFHSFTQLDDSKTRRHAGTGIGLSIANGIIKLMHGSLSVQSQPSHGSVFSVTLNFPLAPPATPHIAITSLPHASTTSIQRTIPRILVAEDNLVNQKVIRQHLKRFGLTADIVCNGREALTALDQKNYDLVFMDCHMPELDGLAATRQIRAQEGTKGTAHIPIVALTAGLLEQDRAACLAAGMDEYLPKPLNPQSILTVLHRFLPTGSFSP